MALYCLQYPDVILKSEETKFLIGCGNRGKKHSEKWCQNISNSKKGVKFSEEHCLHLGESHIGKKHTVEWKKNQSIVQLQRYENLEERKKSSDITRERYKDPKERKKTSDALKKFYENPEETEKLSKVQTKNWSDPLRHKLASDRVKHVYLIGDVKYLNITRESDEHKKTKNKIASLLRSLGLLVETERFITVNGHRYAVDIYAKKENGDIMVFEIGDCKKKKLCDLQTCYSFVFHVPKQVIGEENI